MLHDIFFSDEERGSSESPQKNASSSSSVPNNSNMNNATAGNHSQGGPSANRKLGSFMTARMPQKQRELFERIEQQHSVQHEQEDIVEGGLDDTPINPNNVNWYSSDEDGETPSAEKIQGQGLVRICKILLFRHLMFV